MVVYLCTVKTRKPARNTRDADDTRKAAGPKRTARSGVQKPGVAKPERAKLEKELRASISELDEKGLLFLLRQAQVLIHNARLENLSGTRRHETADEEPAAASPRPAPVKHPETVSIEEADGGKTIFINIGRARKIMAREEMKRLVRICYGAETRTEALRQLFTVLVKERRDILTDAVIGSPDSPLLRGLFDAVREKYQLPDR